MIIEQGTTHHLDELEVLYDGLNDYLSSTVVTDTIGYEEAQAINPNVTNSLVDDMFHQYAWYRDEDDYGCLLYTSLDGSEGDLMMFEPFF